MKNLFITIFGLILLASCGGEASDSLETLKESEKAIETQIKELKTELAEIKAEIVKIDPSSKEVSKELVTVLPLMTKEYDHYIEVQGKSFAEDNVMVTTDMGGLVKAVYVDEGQYVSKGKTLIQLDNAVAQNQIAELQTASGLAKDIFDKRKRLWDQNIGSEIEYLQAKNNYESLQDKLATANTQLYKSSIKAPISGYVDNISLQVGEMASPGAPAVQVVNTNDMEVHVALPEIYLGEVARGDEIIVNFPALNQITTAKVKSVGQTINMNNRTFQVIASVDNKDGKIKPNLLAKVKINDQKIADAITIPTKLLQESNSSYFVFIAVADSATNETLAKRIEIEVGSSYGEEMVVTKGLSAGDLLIDAGYRKVREGMHLIISE